MSSQQALTDQLSSATKAGNLPLVESLYSQLNRSRESLDEIARQAAEHAQPSLLEWCFQQGFALPAESLNNSFFHAAISGRSPAIFQVLLKHGFDLNAHWSEYDGDAVVVACMDGDVPLARFLLEHGQDPNLGHCCGDYEALVWAIIGDKPAPSTKMEMVRLMLDHGTKLKGTGAIIAAAETGNLEILKLLLEGGHSGLLEEKATWWGVTDRESIDSEGTAIYRACRAGKDEVVEFLLDQGADGRSTDKIGRSCLNVARARGHDKVVKLLEERGIKE